MGAEGKWVVISIAHDQERAQQMERLLQAEGFMPRLNRIAHANEDCYEIMTLSCEAQEARDLLTEQLGG